jgi:hypothetical protein
MRFSSGIYRAATCMFQRSWARPRFSHTLFEEVGACKGRKWFDTITTVLYNPVLDVSPQESEVKKFSLSVRMMIGMNWQCSSSKVHSVCLRKFVPSLLEKAILYMQHFVYRQLIEALCVSSAVRYSGGDNADAVVQTSFQPLNLIAIEKQSNDIQPSIHPTEARLRFHNGRQSYWICA